MPGSAASSTVSGEVGSAELCDVATDLFRADIEEAAYFVCAEAMTNVSKYPGATTTTVSIHVAGSALIVEVADDGVGGADPAAGTGLSGIQDRLDVLGGSLTVTSSRHGTHVRGVIPL